MPDTVPNQTPTATRRGPFLMLASDYLDICLLGEIEARRQGKWPEGCLAWDEAFLDVPHYGYREIWDVSKTRSANGEISFDVGPHGRTVVVPGDATVKVRA